MSEKDQDIVSANPWRQLRQFTPARIALGRVGSSLPTDEVLRFGLAHSLARDAVHVPLDTAKLAGDLAGIGGAALQCHSKAADRAVYLLRPDLGRRLSEESADALRAVQAKGCDVLFVIADGLSAQAAQRHAVPLLREVRARLPATWSVGPVVIARQARVALGDDIAVILRAKNVVMMIGERPGLSSPDSLGVYFTCSPWVGVTDAERNCISNIRPEGLPYPEAANKLVWLLQEARRIGMSGIALKDRSGNASLPGP